ncbi:hypothetical protein BDN71DRAFT_1505770 [Pleurotus eryngii]|uniref:Protein kinase domain-containing protein n=1 Tax=Pleurotus eryngii TaxID=5323 RepID=A0A9P6A275_PLEER|nr:hypothetical protein BDN71DRAFT_1505770 [Pleurotus eryngii]
MSLYALVLIGDPPLTALSYSQLCPLPWTAKTTITEVDAIIKKSLRMPGELEYYLLDVPLKPSTLAGIRDLSKPLQDHEELLFHSVRLWPQEFDSSFDDLHVEKPVGRERVVSLVVIWCPTPLETSEPYPPATIVEDFFGRDAVAQSGRQRDPPSTGAKSCNLVPAQQVNQPAAAFNYRPQELTPSPLSLYNPAFATFRRGMANLTKNFKFSKEEVERATDFIVISSKYYVDENARMTALRQCSLFPTPERSQSAWCTSEIQTNATIIKPDGNIPLALAVRIVICFLELKNGGGDGGCDPNEQVQLDFIKVVSSDQYAPVRSVSCCPTFLVSLSGSQLAIWGAVFAERFFFEPLAFLHVGPQPVCTDRSPSETGVREVAKVLRLLNDALDELTSYYKTLPIPPPVHVSSYGKKIRSGKHANSTTTSRISSSHAARFPHWTSFKIGANKATLTYTRRLAGDTDFERTVFLAKMTSESISPSVRDVVVKFTYRYSEDGHRLLADKNLAPTLYHCAYEETVGMWVVVMDVVEGGTARKGNKLNIEQGKSLRHAVGLLHAKGLVFGDLREPNVIVKPDTICLIDFEWCGRCEDVDGKGLGVRYPTHIAMGPDYDWAEGVGPDEFIRKAHDLHLVQQMCGA